MADFDPYYEWLAIPLRDQPPNHYRLLGIELYEAHLAVIERAADKQMAFLRTVANGKQGAIAQRLLNEVAVARRCLLTPEKKAAYDQQLRESRVSGADITTSLAPTARQTPATARPPYQARLLGEYEVLEKIGAGGMGQVFKARHRRMKRIVALKVLPPRSGHSADSIDRFQREVEAAAKLSHPNIVTAYDAGEQNGILYLAMEYVEGIDLNAYVKQHGPLPVEHAVECVIQAARGLLYAHQQGIVHRDVKPANLLLDRDGTVKILDMGLARIDDLMSPGAELTSTGQIVGTIEFMSPEQAEDTHRVDLRADIYSLGCTFYRLVTAQPLYSCESQIGTLLAHRQAPVRSLREVRPEISSSLDAVFQRMVAKRPDQRFSSMAELIAALEAARSNAHTLHTGQGTDSDRLREVLATIAKNPSPKVTETSVRARPQSPPGVGAHLPDSWPNNRTWFPVVAGICILVLAIPTLTLLTRFQGQPTPTKGKAVVVAKSTADGFPLSNQVRKVGQTSPSWENLLSLVDPKRDALRGEWELVDDRLRCKKSGFAHRLVIPRVILGGYRLRVGFVSNDEFGISLVLPVGSSQVGLEVDNNKGGGASYLAIVNGKDRWDADNPTMCREFRVVPGKEHELDVEVAISGSNATLRIAFDGRQGIHWEGPQSSLTNWAGNSVPLGHVGIYDLGETRAVASVLIEEHNTKPTEASAPAMNADRRAAEWALAQSGYIKVIADGNISGLFNDRASLPATDFHLVDVYLEGKPIEDADLAILAPLCHVGYVKFSGTRIDGSGLKHLFNSKPKVVGLVLNQTAVGDPQADMICEFTNLKYLHLDDTKVSDLTMAKLSSLRHLVMLEVRRTAITDEGIRSLVRTPQLSHLALDGTGISDVGLLELRQLSDLKVVTLTRTQVSAQAIEALQQQFPHCKITRPE
jgi:serine/threonine protein kinase